MRRGAAVLWLALACSLGAAAFSAQLLHAYNKQNPRWEALEHGELRKGYRPLHLPPGDLPPRQHRWTRNPHGQLLGALAGILAAAVAGQWLASWIGLPAALPLLVLGVIAGPVTGVLSPDVVFGNLLFPLVAMALALILFLDALRVKTVRVRGGTPVRVAMIGMLSTAVVAGVAAYVVLNVDLALAVLLGLILAMTASAGAFGLRRRATRELNAILAGEGVILDLAGSILVILVLEAASVGAFRQFGNKALLALRNTLISGILFGALGGMVLHFLLQHRWVPRFLERAAPLVLVIAVFALAEMLQTGSGFLAVIAMGVGLSSRKTVTLKYVTRLRGNLSETLLAALFVVLIARVPLDSFVDVGGAGAVFVAIVVLISRPLAVGLATLGDDFGWRERALVSLLAPRGMLAAGLCTLCALRLSETGDPHVLSLVPLTLWVIACTAAVATLTGLFVARPAVDGAGTDERPGKLRRWALVRGR